MDLEPDGVNCIVLGAGRGAGRAIAPESVEFPGGFRDGARPAGHREIR